MSEELENLDFAISRINATIATYAARPGDANREREQYYRDRLDRALQKRKAIQQQQNTVAT